MIDLQAIQERLEAAMGGPYLTEYDHGDHRTIRNDIDALIDEVKRLRALLADVCDHVEGCCNCLHFAEDELKERIDDALKERSASPEQSRTPSPDPNRE